MAQFAGSKKFYQPDYGAKDYCAEQARETAEIEQWKASLRKPGTVLGQEITFPVADGYARYVVVSEKPLKLVHLAVGDAWMVNSILLRGLRLTDVKVMLEREDLFRQLTFRNIANRSV